MNRSDTRMTAYSNAAIVENSAGNPVQSVSAPTRIFQPKDGTKVYWPSSQKKTSVKPPVPPHFPSDALMDVLINGNNTAKRPPFEEPPLEEPQLEDPPLEEPQLEDPPLEEPQLEDPPLEEPPFEEPPLEEPPFEEPPLEEPQLEDPPLEEPLFEEPPLEEPLLEEPAFEEPPFEEAPFEEPPFEEVPFDDEPQPDSSEPFPDMLMKPDDDLAYDADFDDDSEKGNVSYRSYSYYPNNQKKVKIRPKISLRSGNKVPLMQLEITVNSIPCAVFYPRANDFPIVFGREPKKREASSSVRIAEKSNDLKDTHILLSIVNDRLIIKKAAADGENIYYTPEGSNRPILFDSEMFVESSAFVFSVGNVSISVRMYPEIGRYLKKIYSLRVQTFANKGSLKILSVSDKEYLCGRAYHPRRGESVYPLNLNIGPIAQVNDGTLLPTDEKIRFTTDGKKFQSTAELSEGTVFHVFYSKKNLAQISVSSLFDPEKLFGISNADSKPDSKSEKGGLLHSLTAINRIEYTKAANGKIRDRIFEISVTSGGNSKVIFTEMRNLPVLISNRYDDSRTTTSQLAVWCEETDFEAFIDVIKDRPYLTTRRINGLAPTVTSGMQKTACFDLLRYDITASVSSFQIGSTEVEVKILPEATEKHFQGVNYTCRVECLLAQDENGYVYRNASNQTLTVPKYRDVIIHEFTTFGRNPDKDVLLFDGRPRKSVSRNAFYAKSDIQGLSLVTDKGEAAFRWYDSTKGEYVETNTVPLNVGQEIKYRDAYILRITGQFRLSDHIICPDNPSHI